MAGRSPQDDADLRSDPQGARTIPLELLHAGLRSARRLPGDLLRLPVTGALTAMSALGALRRRQGGLGGLGLAALDRLVRLRAPGGTDHSTDRLYETEEQTAAVEREADEIRRTARSHLQEVPPRPKQAARPSRPPAKAASKAPGKAPAKEGAKAPAKKAAKPPTKQAAPPAGAAEPAHPVPPPEEQAEQPHQDTAPAPTGAAEHYEPPPPLEADDAPKAEDLPLPDFDHMTLASLRARLRRLDISQLTALRDYERAHANRLQVVMMLENRIARLESAPSGDQQTSTAG